MTNWLDIKQKEYSNEKWLEGFVEAQQEEYLEKANTDKVGLAECVSVQHKILTYDLALNLVVAHDYAPEEVRNFIIKTRRALHTFLAKKLDGVAVAEKDMVSMSGNTYQELSSNNKLKYVGKPDHHAWELGEVYSIIEVGNWFHNNNELGYYLTTNEYDGDDIDYGCFYPMGTLGEDFEVLNG